MFWRARGRKIEFARISLGVGDELRQRRDGKVAAHCNRLRAGADVGDRHELLHRIVGQLLQLRREQDHGRRQTTACSRRDWPSRPVRFRPRHRRSAGSPPRRAGRIFRSDAPFRAAPSCRCCRRRRTARSRSPSVRARSRPPPLPEPDRDRYTGKPEGAEPCSHDVSQHDVLVRNDTRNKAGPIIPPSVVGAMLWGGSRFSEPSFRAGLCAKLGLFVQAAHPTSGIASP